MFIWFFISVLGVFVTVPLHFLSVEHQKLQSKYGKTKGVKIGETLGLISGWGLFFFWSGIWIAPQPRLIVPFATRLIILQGFEYSIPFLHLIISVPFLMLGAWLAIKGIKKTTLRVAEIHRTERIVTSGVYSIVRHPQYLGGLLAHLGISFLLSAGYSLISTPLMVGIIYFISRKEEEELVREFRKEYEDYKKKVSILIPCLSMKNRIDGIHKLSLV